MLAAHFVRRGYPLEILDTAFSKVNAIDRNVLLNLEDQEVLSQVDSNQEINTPVPPPEKLFSITTYNPVGNPNQQLIKANWPMLGKSNTTLPLFKCRVIHGNRRAPNLRDILVHSKLKILSTTNRGVSGSTFRDCTTRTCRYCPRFNKTGIITSLTTGRNSKCCKNFTCHSSNLIYCIKCTHCNMLYVGQTKRELKKRLVEHFSYITKPDLSQPLGIHFTQPNHPKLDAVEIYVLKYIKASPDSDLAKSLRDHHELKWIHRLRSALPHGLNSMD